MQSVHISDTAFDLPASFLSLWEPQDAHGMRDKMQAWVVHCDGDSSRLTAAAQASNGEQSKSDGQTFCWSSPSINLTDKFYRAIEERSLWSLPSSWQSYQEIGGYLFPFHFESMKWQTKVKYFAERNELVGLFWKFTQEHNLWTF